MIWGAPIKPLPFKLVVQGREEIWRAGDFWTKEPETIAWIDSFAPDSVFWDIGANIGVFSLYALHKCHAVHAFEPCIENFDRARLNFYVNAADLRGERSLNVDLKRMAFGDTPGTAKFNLPVTGPGTSGGQVGATVDEMGRKFTPIASYDVDVVTVDMVVKELGRVPDHIKIDVDGHEEAIIRGAVNTLNDSNLKSVLVETNRGGMVDDVMAKSGFTVWNPFNAQDINRRHGQKRMNVIYTRRQDEK